jgi:arabinan endo-1,5-alpha-L-arabinosidase
MIADAGAHCGPGLTAPATVRSVAAGRAAGATAVLVWFVLGCGDGVGPEPDPCPAAGVGYPAEVTQTGATYHVHDPEIVRDGDFYYILSTNDGIPIRRSADLIHWTFLGRVFPNQVPVWASGVVPGVQAPWAPGVAHFNERFHLYYSLSTFGSARSAIGLATNRTLDPGSPGYAWEDHGVVVQSGAWQDATANAIDAAVVEDGDGGLWLTWGSWGGGIRIQALDRETGLLLDPDALPVSLARRPIVEAVEGPYIVRRGEYYYLFVSFDLCCRGLESTYSVRVGRSSSVTGPYVDREGTPMLVGGGSVVMAGYGRVIGPGHASVLVEDDRYLLVHHYYDGEANGLPHVQIRPLLWDDEGWPLADLPLGWTPAAAPVGTPVVGRWGYWAGMDPAREVRFRADGTAVACDATGTWSYATPMLTVVWQTRHGTRTDRNVLSGDGRSMAGRDRERIVRGYLMSPDP